MQGGVELDPAGLPRHRLDGAGDRIQYTDRAIQSIDNEEPFTIRCEYKSDGFASHLNGQSEHLLRRDIIGHDAPGAVGDLEPLFHREPVSIAELERASEPLRKRARARAKHGP